MQPGSSILAEDGVLDGSPIEVAVAGDFRMRGPRGAFSGALISASNRKGGSGGNISIFVTGGILAEPGSRIASDAGAEAGDITITGRTTDMRGAVSSRAAAARREGAISIVSTSDETARGNASPSS